MKNNIVLPLCLLGLILSSYARTDTDSAKTAKGVVTLSGSARSLDQIGKAIALSLDTGEVTQVISSVKLEKAP
jgi:hypothetical protein